MQSVQIGYPIASFLWSAYCVTPSVSQGGYGYAMSSSGLLPDESEQAVLVRLQLWREAGYSFRLIAASLNAAGYRTRGYGKEQVVVVLAVAE